MQWIPLHYDALADIILLWDIIESISILIDVLIIATNAENIALRQIDVCNNNIKNVGYYLL